MTTAMRVFWCSMGALLPALIIAYNIDFNIVFDSFSMKAFMAIALRTFIGMILASTAAIWTQGETNILKLIKEGATAPLILSTFLATRAAAPPQISWSMEPVDWSIVAMAGAAEKEPNVLQANVEVKEFQDTKFFDLLTLNPGKTHYIIAKEVSSDVPENVRYKIALSFAIHLKDEFAKKNMVSPPGRPQLVANVYQPYKNLMNYTVVIGEALSHEDADFLIDFLVRNDFTGMEIFDIACECFPNRSKK